MPDTATYYIASERSTVTVRANATLHGVTSRGSGLSGTLVGDPEALEGTAGGTVIFPMEQMSFGDPIRDFALHRHLNTKQWPRAEFKITNVSVLTRDPWQIQATGLLMYRGTSAPLVVSATGTVDSGRLEAKAQFLLDLPSIGVAPPRFLFLKVANKVEVEVQLYASRAE